MVIIMITWFKRCCYGHGAVWTRMLLFFCCSYVCPQGFNIFNPGKVRGDNIWRLVDRWTMIFAFPLLQLQSMRASLWALPPPERMMNCVVKLMEHHSNREGPQFWDVIWRGVFFAWYLIHFVWLNFSLDGCPGWLCFSAWCESFGCQFFAGLGSFWTSGTANLFCNLRGRKNVGN